PLCGQLGSDRLAVAEGPTRGMHFRAFLLELSRELYIKIKNLGDNLFYISMRCLRRTDPWRTR
ncbi:MAG: hypothetical protein ACPIOQ_15140, partial [Promethearchaeia archaeon]